MVACDLRADYSVVMYRICVVGLLLAGLVLSLWSLVRFWDTDNFLLILFCGGASLFFALAILGTLSRARV